MVPWYMVTRNTLRTWKKVKKNEFVTAVDLNKCLKQIKLPVYLYTCAPILELPSNISTMVLDSVAESEPFYFYFYFYFFYELLSFILFHTFSLIHGAYIILSYHHIRFFLRLQKNFFFSQWPGPPLLLAGHLKNYFFAASLNVLKAILVFKAQ